MTLQGEIEGIQAIFCMPFLIGRQNLRPIGFLQSTAISENSENDNNEREQICKIASTGKCVTF